MGVLDRWRHFKDDARYRKLFDHQELWQIAEQIFDVSSQAFLRPQSSQAKEANVSVRIAAICCTYPCPREIATVIESFLRKSRRWSCWTMLH